MAKNSYRLTSGGNIASRIPVRPATAHMDVERVTLAPYQDLTGVSLRGNGQGVTRIDAGIVAMGGHYSDLCDLWLVGNAIFDTPFVGSGIYGCTITGWVAIRARAKENANSGGFAIDNTWFAGNPSNTRGLSFDGSGSSYVFTNGHLENHGEYGMRFTGPLGNGDVAAAPFDSLVIDGWHIESEKRAFVLNNVYGATLSNIQCKATDGMEALVTLEGTNDPGVAPFGCNEIVLENIYAPPGTLLVEDRRLGTSRRVWRATSWMTRRLEIP